jgi:hypothetical protein
MSEFECPVCGDEFGPFHVVDGVLFCDDCAEVVEAALDGDADALAELSDLGLF